MVVLPRYNGCMRCHRHDNSVYDLALRRWSAQRWTGLTNGKLNHRHRQWNSNSQSKPRYMLCPGLSNPGIRAGKLDHAAESFSEEEALEVRQRGRAAGGRRAHRRL